MKILMVAAEVAPYASVGGLSQVIYFLSNALLKRGHDVRVFSAKYGIITPKKPFQELVHHLHVPTGYQGKDHPEHLVCNVVTNTLGHQTAYFLENQEYYELRSNVYDYKDDPLRFFLLSRGCLEWLKHQAETKGWIPELIHAHDWHTSYLCEDIRTNPRYKHLFQAIPVLLTAHNFHHQGSVNFQFIPDSERDTGKTPLPHFFHDDLLKQNPLMRGITYSDWVSTVSETHAHEVLTPEYGEGLDKFLLKHRGKLSGILNGLDAKEFNPINDPLIAKNYKSYNPKVRQINKSALQKEFRLPVKDVPVIAYSGRLSKQKGIELILEVIPHLLEEYDLQFIVMGSGDMQYRKDLQALQQTYPQKVGVHLYTNFKLPRKIFAGADVVLLPSHFEPGGIVAVEALRYGAIPIIRQTGGLADIITDFNPSTGVGNGFTFIKPSPWALYGTIVKALTLLAAPNYWSKLVDNAMSSDFSWEYAAKEYETLYRRVTRLRNQFIKDNPHPSRAPQ